MDTNEIMIVEDDSSQNKKKKHKRLKIVFLLLIIVVLLLLIFFLLSREETEVYIREYEKHVEQLWEKQETKENPRINIAVSQRYEISDESPLFYIGYPEDNQFDIVLTFYDEVDNVLYETKYIQPGTNVAIDGTNFVSKDIEEYRCNISAFDRKTGKLVSNSVNVIMKIHYE